MTRKHWLWVLAAFLIATPFKAAWSQDEMAPPSPIVQGEAENALQNEDAAPDIPFKIRFRGGVQTGLGLSGQFALGARFFLMGEEGDFGTGLGLSFLLGERNVFVRSRNTTIQVNGVTVFTEILFKWSGLDPFQLQAAAGMAIVNRGGRTRGLPVELTTQGVYFGADVRYILDRGALSFLDNALLEQDLFDRHLAVYAGARVAYLDAARLTITGHRQIVRLPSQPAIFVGLGWSF